MNTHNGKEIAEEYQEDATVLAPDKISEDQVRGAGVVEVDYTTQRNTIKTLRGESPRDPGVAEPDDVDKIVAGFGDDEFAYDVEDIVVTTADVTRDEQAVLATSDDIVEVRIIEYPENVPVVGAPQQDVEAKIYFRSKRNDNIKTKTIEVTALDASYEGPVDATSSNMLIINGTNKADGRKVEASTAWDRKLVTSGRQDVEVGKVVRVEFPLGHRFTVDLRHLLDDEVDVAEEKLEEHAQEITDRYSENIENEESVEVKYEGRIVND